MFADDIVLFTTNHQTLQSQVNLLFRYSEKWGLKINVSKTKVCVLINEEKVQNVDSFTYFGVKFHYTGNMVHAVKALSEQALNAF